MYINQFPSNDLFKNIRRKNIDLLFSYIHFEMNCIGDFNIRGYLAGEMR